MTYWYILHVKEGPIRVMEGGGWRTRFNDEVSFDVTHYKSLEGAKADRRQVLKLRAKWFKKFFKIVKVTVHQKGA